MRRREFIKVIASSAAAWPLVAVASETKPLPKIGWLKIQAKNHTPNHLRTFLVGLGDLGDFEGRSFVLEERYADGDGSRLSALATELVQNKVDIILASSQSAVDVSRRVTQSIPIVGRMTDDPVVSGAAQSLARPGGNVTGVYSLLEGMTDKRLALLQQAVPGLRRVGALLMLERGATARWLAETQEAAKQLGLEIHIMNLRSASDLESAFARAAEQGVSGVIALRNPVVVTNDRLVAELSKQYKMPGVFDAREFVDVGGFMSYGPNLEAIFHQLSGYVDKILKGTKTSDLPIEQPIKFELVLNLKTAKTLGLTVPQTLLVTADDVIE